MAAPAAAQEATAHSDEHVITITTGDGYNALENFEIMHSVGEVNRNRDGYDNGGDQDGAGVEQCSMQQLNNGNIIGCCIGSVAGIDIDIDGDGLIEPGDGDIAKGDYTEVPDTQQLLAFQLSADPIVGFVIDELKYITNADGNRDRNGMHCTTNLVNGGDAVRIVHNFAPDDTNINRSTPAGNITCNENHACRFSRVVGDGLVALSEPSPASTNPGQEGYGIGELIQAKNNDNCSDSNGNPAVVWDECDESGACSARTLHTDGCNGNGRDDNWATGADTICDPANEGYLCTSYRVFDVSIAADHERGRGECFASQSLSDEVGVPTGVCCYTAGNTQPPNRSVRCQAIKMDDGPYESSGRGELGRRLYYEGDSEIDRNGAYVAKNYRDEEGDRVYNTEINIAPTAAIGTSGDNTFVERHQCGYPRGGNKRKGLWQSCASAITFTAGGVNVQSLPEEIDPTHDVAHGKLTSTMWGTTGAAEMKYMHIASSIVGSSGNSATGTLIDWDATTRTITEEAEYNLGVAHDNAHISNVYGNNPNTQGRNYFQPLSGVVNPGYGSAGGFYPDVQEFIAFPFTTRTLRAETGDCINNDCPATPNPEVDYRVNENKLGLEVVFVPAIIDEPAADDGEDFDDEGDGTGNGGGDGSGTGGGTSSEGGCAVASTGSGLGSMAAMAFALFFLIRRRRD